MPSGAKGGLWRTRKAKQTSCGNTKTRWPGLILAPRRFQIAILVHGLGYHDEIVERGVLARLLVAGYPMHLWGVRMVVVGRLPSRSPLMRRVRFTLLWLPAIPFIIACRLLGTRTTFALGATACSVTAEELAEALRDLLEDTQHREHNCGDAPENCPVLKARALLAKLNAAP